MKNKIVVIFFMVILLCGCSNTLMCESKQDKETNKVFIQFKNNMPIKLYWKRDINYYGDALIEIDYLEEKEYLDSFSNIKGLSYSIDKKDRQDKMLIYVKIDYSLYDISNNLKLPAIYSDRISNKRYLENNGYNCK